MNYAYMHLIRREKKRMLFTRLVGIKKEAEVVKDSEPVIRGLDNRGSTVINFLCFVLKNY